jgi:hypothetical protein
MKLPNAKPPAPRESEQPPTTLSLTATATIDLEAAADGTPAPLPRFRMLAYTGGPMRVAGWRYPVIMDLAGLSIPSQARPIRFSHDPTAGVGHTDVIRIEAAQLVATGIISRDTSAAREVVVSSKNGFPWQASIGAAVEEFEFVKENQKVMVNGRQYTGPVNVVRKATLGEISFVDLGADGATSASVAAAAKEQGEPTVNETTANASENVNTSGANPTEPVAAAAAPAATTSLASAPPALTPSTAPAPANPPTVEELRAQAAAETERIAAIRRRCAGQYPQLEAQAILEGWTEQRLALAMIRGNRPTAPAIHAANNTLSDNVLEAACLMTAGLSNLEEAYEEQTLELAQKRFRGGIGLQELLLEAAWANGFTGKSFRDSRAVLRYAFGRTVEAAFSTIDIGGILSNVANKFLLDGFFSVERTWRNICAIRNVSDFKTVTSYRLVGKDQYELVQPGGELKHGTLGQEQYSNKADTYGLVLSIDRRDIINDDLGAITTVPRKLGRGSGLKINDVFWTTFLNNAAFFVAGNNNYLTGTDTALSIDGLTKSEVAFMDQVDGDGKPIGIMPAIVLVPTALSVVGTQLFKSVEMRDTTANTKFPVANPHQGKFRTEVSRYLGNSKYTGFSAKAWYLLAEPNDLPVIEVAFLNGQEAPTIETAEADFNVLGVQMRGYHDFGVALQDPRGGVKAKGEA